MRRALILSAALLMLFVSGCTDKYKTKEELFKEGVRVLNANNPSGAIIAFKNALEKDQNFFEARFQLAKAYRDVGKLDSAENELQKVVRQSPSSAEVHAELGLVLLKNNKAEEAVNELERAASLSPGKPDIFYHLGLAYKARGDTAKAARNIQKALWLGEFQESSQARGVLGALTGGARG